MSKLFDPNKADILRSDDRLRWNNPKEIVAAVEIAPGARVAEIGCGNGWFTFELERAVRPRGMVYALDTQTAMLQILETYRQNYERILMLPCGENSFDLDDSEVDVVFHANVLHECSDAVIHLREANRVLKIGGKLIVIEWKPGVGEDEPGPRADYRLAPQQAREFAEKAGFTVDDTRDIGPYHYAVLASKE